MRVYSGVPEEFVLSQALDSTVLAAFDGTIDTMRALGAEINFQADFPALQAYLNSQAEVVLAISFR
jgi:Asp-tRNA(Asn)/Glu-tRNA(Gln) amidotransferase A subunit family amidase